MIEPHSRITYRPELYSRKEYRDRDRPRRDKDDDDEDDEE